MGSSGKKLCNKKRKSLRISKEVKVLSVRLVVLDGLRKKNQVFRGEEICEEDLEFKFAIKVLCE